MNINGNPSLYILNLNSVFFPSLTHFSHLQLKHPLKVLLKFFPDVYYSLLFPLLFAYVSKIDEVLMLVLDVILDVYVDTTILLDLIFLPHEKSFVLHPLIKLLLCVNLHIRMLNTLNLYSAYIAFSYVSIAKTQRPWLERVFRISINFISIHQITFRIESVKTSWYVPHLLPLWNLSLLIIIIQ